MIPFVHLNNYQFPLTPGYKFEVNSSAVFLGEYIRLPRGIFTQECCKTIKPQIEVPEKNPLNVSIDFNQGRQHLSKKMLFTEPSSTYYASVQEYHDPHQSHRQPHASQSQPP